MQEFVVIVMTSTSGVTNPSHRAILCYGGAPDM